jgi:hypothetical protein
MRRGWPGSESASFDAGSGSATLLSTAVEGAHHVPPHAQARAGTWTPSHAGADAFGGSAGRRGRHGGDGGGGHRCSMQKHMCRRAGCMRVCERASERAVAGLRIVLSSNSP